MENSSQTHCHKDSSMTKQGLDYSDNMSSYFQKGLHVTALMTQCQGV